MNTVVNALIVLFFIGGFWAVLTSAIRYYRQKDKQLFKVHLFLIIFMACFVLFYYSEKL